MNTYVNNTQEESVHSQLLFLIELIEEIIEAEFYDEDYYEQFDTADCRLAIYRYQLLLKLNKKLILDETFKFLIRKNDFCANSIREIRLIRHYESITGNYVEFDGDNDWLDFIEEFKNDLLQNLKDLMALILLEVDAQKFHLSIKMYSRSKANLL